VVEYRQKNFLPAMKGYKSRLVRYVVGDVDQEQIILRENYVDRRLVLLAQDEMTAQANDITSKTWVFEDQHRLRKKGVGRGLHQSDVLCSTVGWLGEGTQTLEYGKNYKGYWTGELFVKQVNSSQLLCEHALTTRKLFERSRKKLFLLLSVPMDLATKLS
jgi:hypothetical protein